MNTSIDEIANKIYRLSTFVEPPSLRFNQFLILAEKPLLFHCGLRKLFPQLYATASRVVPLEKSGGSPSDISKRMNVAP